MNSKKFDQARRDRRRFVGASVAFAAGMCFSTQAPALIINRESDRLLAFHNLHTDEDLACRYFSRGGYDTGALRDIDYILRDHRAGEIHAINRDLLDLLTVVRSRLGTTEPLHVISGYRSPETNALLRKKSKGIAKRSLHMQGKAIDIRIPGVPLARLRQTGLDLEAGGVGYYPRSAFVHLDIGRPRHW